MANIYWVGGTGTWDTSTTTHWASSSGGTGGTGTVPTAADTVFFDSGSGGTYTVTMSGALTCLNINISAGAPTFTSTGTLTISGSMNITNITPTWSATGLITFISTTTGNTITTNGTAFAAAFTFNGSGGYWTLGSSLTTTSTTAFTVNAGTFDTSSTGNYALTIAGTLTISSSATAILNLNASTVTLPAATPLSLGSAGVLNAGTSQINCTFNGSISFNGNGKTFYNVAFPTAVTTSAVSTNISGQNTFYNLSYTAPSVVGYRIASFSSNQTISGALTTTGTAGNQRVWFQTTVYGFQLILTCNSAASLTDADFRDIIVNGTASPISGTRIGDLGGNLGITTSTPKTVYWSLTAGGNWSSNAWATSSGGTPAASNFPLAQDTAIIDNTGLTTGNTITLDTVFAWIGSIDMSSRTNAMTLTNTTTPITVYGNWKNSSAVTVAGTASLTFASRNTQSVTSAGVSFSQAINITSFGGSFLLNDAFSISSGANPTLSIVSGTFDTQGYSISVPTLSVGASSTPVAPCNVYLRSSTITVTYISGAGFNTGPLLTVYPGTSTLNITSVNSSLTNYGSVSATLYNVSMSNGGQVISGAFTYSGTLTLNNPSSGGYRSYIISGGIQTINTLSASGSSATGRVFISASSVSASPTSTPTVLNVTTFSSPSDIDFRDITLTGAAAGTSVTRGGDCGGNSGITFPAAKTVYWNLTGSQTWFSTGWATSSGGTPAANNIPLGQDTAIIDNNGAATTINFSGGYISTLDVSSRTSSVTFAGSIFINGNLKLGTGVVSPSAFNPYFTGRNTTQQILSNGISISGGGNGIVIFNINGTVQQSDALNTDLLTLTNGGFNSSSYNTTITTRFVNTSTSTRTLNMGSGTWTLAGTGTVWNTASTGLTYYAGTSTIVLSDTSTTARTFTGGGFYYNKLTIGGTTGVSTTTLGAGDTYGELASTKTVSHTISFSTISVGKWSVTGTSGNLVTVTGTTLTLFGDRVSGVDYLTMGTTAMSATNPVEFYAGVNSTGSGVILTAAPAAVTRYWVGGTGSWTASATANWSATSGGAGGASVPTSADTVIFNSASNATAYSVTLSSVTPLRCYSLSVSGPASGSLVFAGSAQLCITHDFTMASTGISRTYTGAITFSGAGTGKTISCGQTLASSITFATTGSWSLTAALNIGTSTLTITSGTFNTAGFTLTGATLTLTYSSGATTPISLSFGASAINLTTSINFTGSSTTVNPTNLTFSSGTSTITISGTSNAFYHGGQTFYNVAFTDQTSGISVPLNQSIFPVTFNNLTMWNPGTTGYKQCNISSNITVNGTLTFTQGTNSASRRIFLFSGTLGTQYTITAASVSNLNNIDFRDIKCAGAATWSGTSIGDCGGNSGLTASTPKTVYWSLTAGGSWAAGVPWATSSGGTPADANFPLAQDTAIIQNTGLNTSSTITMDNIWNIGTVDMSTRSNAWTFAISNGPTLYGNWLLSSATTYSGSGQLTFSGRGTQTITSGGASYTGTNQYIINSFSGTVQLADALAISSSLVLTSGTFNAASYNVTASLFSTAGSSSRTLSMGSGTWSLTSNPTPWTITTTTGLTFNKGSANINLSGGSGTNFTGGSLTYNGLSFGGSGFSSTSALTGNNTFSAISSSRTGIWSLNLGTTIQSVGAFSVSGSSGNLVSIFGTSTSTPATMVYTGSSTVNVDYISTSSLRVYSLTNTWYAGTHSVDGGTLGWIYAAIASTGVLGQFFFFF